MRLFTLLAFLLAPVATAQEPAPPAPPIKLPAKVTTKAGDLGKLRAETAGKFVEWVALTPGLSIDPIDNGRTLYYSGLPGVYELLAYTASGDVPSKPARVTVVIGDGPQPTPPPPKASDPLRTKLKVAFDAAAGTSDEKTEWAKDLAALYRAAAQLVTDPATTTAAALKAKLRDAAARLIGPDALKEVRQVVAGELAAVLPATDADLTGAQRAATAALFIRLAEILDGI